LKEYHSCNVSSKFAINFIRESMGVFLYLSPASLDFSGDIQRCDRQQSGIHIFIMMNFWL